MGYEPAIFPDLSGRTVVVTGAARGIGEAHVLGLLRNGVNVVAADLDHEAMSATAQRLGEHRRHGARIVARAADVVRAEDHHALAQAAVDEFGSLDGWVNNAGVLRTGALMSTSEDEFTEMHRVHGLGSMFGSQAAAATMGQSGGAILNVASTTAYVVRPTLAAYSASKAAVEHLTKFQAVELGPQGIRVNAVAPGMVDTAMTDRFMKDPEALERALSGIPLRRLGEPGEVSDAMLFLLSDASSFITGHTIVVDGGSRFR